MEDEEEFLETEDEEEFPEDAAVEADGDEGEEAEEQAEDLSGDESLDEILAKRPEERPVVEEEEDEESLLGLERDERVETLTVRVIPQQPTEFTCRKCYLVKHRSQLADKKRMYCRDCA